ncbi:MAG: hypothetical protein WC071_07630 [Victivallaceae bacterium]
MKITEDIIKALHNCIDTVGSISEFSQRTNVNIETLSKYMTHKSESIRKDTWDKIYPLLHPYLHKNGDKSPAGGKKPQRPVKPIAKTNHDLASLSSDEKILLDAFSALPPKVKEKKLLEIVDLAKLEVRKDKSD